MALTLYIEPQTALHRLHPVTKLVAMLCLFFSAFFTDQPLALLPLTAVVAGLLWIAGAGPNVRRLRVLFVLVFVMAFVIWTFFYRRGTPIFAFGYLQVSAAALEFALGMAMKLTTFLAIGILFLSITTIEETSHGLVQLGMPYKLGFTITLAFRLVPVFVESAFTVIQAQRSRGFDFERGRLHERIRRYVPVIVPVFIGALRRADGMAMALEARGFQRRLGRTIYAPYRFTAADLITLSVATAVAFSFLWLWKAGYSVVIDR